LETLADYLPYPENILELSDLFPILWQQIPQEEIDNLIRRIREVIRVLGRNTDYLKLKQIVYYVMRSKNEVLCAAAGRLAAERSDSSLFDEFVCKLGLFGTSGPF
jgi:hypothetical protein